MTASRVTLELSTVAVLVGALALLSKAPNPSRALAHEAPLLPRAGFVHAAAASCQTLASDYYWVQTLQALARASTAEEYRDIYDYAKLVADLDPGFRTIYGFAGAAIPFNLGREHWVNTRESTDMLERGNALFPRSVDLKLALAYNYSYFHHDYRRAADLLTQAARLPGAPTYLPVLATRLYAQAGAFDVGLTLAQALRDAATTPETQALFDQRLKEIELERVLTRIETAAAEFAKTQARAAGSVHELVEAKLLPDDPTDPLGGTLLLDPEGHARSTAQVHRLKAYDPRVDTQ